ncbi:hypothetical protein ACFWXO_16075 [Kitasatospora sp. NPDC059088]|uniref:hypothetical protein n=1 Tax=Kitasatospora sp. NPDC059088 TaxID=3346722 RepID=UPI00369A8881
MTWTFPTSRISHDGAGTVVLEICHRVSDYTAVPRRRGQVFWTSSPLPDGATLLDVYCPVCTADRGLTVSGTWGGPAELTCLCGHSWTPRVPTLSPEQLLRSLVRLALEGSFLGIRYRMIKVDPVDRHPTPLQDAVHPVVIAAERELNLRQWEFTYREGSIASELLKRAGQRAYWSPEALAALVQQKRPTDEESLAWVVDNYRALETCSMSTGGRLGRFLSEAATALRPIDGMTMDDLEPGVTWSRMPPALDDARGALGAVHVVLTAGVTDDVDY